MLAVNSIQLDMNLNRLVVGPSQSAAVVVALLDVDEMVEMQHSTLVAFAVW